MKKQVICINWGTKYGPKYINRLYAAVARNITPPFSFTCFTDSFEGIRPEVDCQPLPDIPVEIPKTKRGIWPKARLWGPRLGDLEGPVLFLDLDLVITGSLDGFFTYGEPDKVILSRNPAKPFERVGQTSCFRFPVGKLLPLQEEFCENPLGIAEEYVWEQRFVTRNAPGGVDFFPARWVRHFRYQCIPTFPLNWFKTPKLTRDASIVIFPGGVMPEAAITGGWKGREGFTLAQHLRGIRNRPRHEGSLWRYLRHYVKPTPWVAEAWRE
ncbi:glycosyl transferase [Sedimentimonas flavescens]|uniref:Glycosyl transferase n=1 Tax=Sedimentimonas flavescens TaxID=2851012 RepID=A0ABT3A2Z1_9RHOB|nr:glycosyl transferase [Sedimentimonas flavescens]MCV2879960.1 glycosyl transferase [Sedimentimonas flavescens]